MPTHALLGATGATGSAVLRCFIASPPPDLQLNIFVRSKAKLLKTFPDLESTSAIRTSITEANITDTDAMQQCLRDADFIHHCIATNEPRRGNSVAVDTANAILLALETLKQKQGPAYKTPTLIVLRSASLNPPFGAEHPELFHRLLNRFLRFALYYVYEDLDQACKLLARAAESDPGLLEYIFVDPPGLHDTVGTECTGFELLLVGELSACLNYADLGAAFVEVARREDEFKGKAVAVSGTGTIREDWSANAWYIGLGLRNKILGW